ncbi:hypothetical protein DsansV1_C10g0104221 [Dioscorea sansibarensis]
MVVTTRNISTLWLCQDLIVARSAESGFISGAEEKGRGALADITDGPHPPRQVFSSPGGTAGEQTMSGGGLHISQTL